MGTRGSRARSPCQRIAESRDERLVHVRDDLRAVMLDALLPSPASEVIKPQAVLFKIDDLEEAGAQEDPFVGWQQAMKDGVLHALAVVRALLRDAA